MLPETESHAEGCREDLQEIIDQTTDSIHETHPGLYEKDDRNVHELSDTTNDEVLSDISGTTTSSLGLEISNRVIPLKAEPKPLPTLTGYTTQTSYLRQSTYVDSEENQVTIDLSVTELKQNCYAMEYGNVREYQPSDEEIDSNLNFSSENENDKGSASHNHENDSYSIRASEQGNDHCSSSSIYASENDLDSDENDEEPVSTVNFPTHEGASDSKYRVYKVLVDPEQDDRAVEIALCSMARPHMRCFHCAWISFFVAFMCWFVISPLLSEVTISLNLTKEQIWTSNILSVSGSAILRILVGPLCDKYGARLCSVGILLVTALPTITLGLSNSFETFTTLRLLIGMAGATFVTGQYWTSSMFTREVAGTANALVAGWGNLGGGITQLLSGSVLFPMFRWMYGGKTITDVVIETNEDDPGRMLSSVHRVLGRSEDRAWRSVPVIPGLISLATSWFFYRYADDSPKGNYHKRKKQGFIVDVKVWEALIDSMRDFNTWILFFQYGCCFGVELTVSNAAALYFKDQFGLSTESAAAIASIFGWMNIFARGLGGFMSDMCNAWDGMRGRLAWQTCCLLCEGLATILFAYSKSLISSIFTLALFSFFVQATEGSTFGIVPYVNPRITGSIVGVVGAGGNVGGICFSYLFRTFSYEQAFIWMGWWVVGSSLLSFFILIRGHAGLTCGRDSPEVRTALRRRNRNEDENSHEVERIEISQSEISIPINLDVGDKNFHEDQDIDKDRNRPDLSGADIHVSKVISLTNGPFNDTDNFAPNQEYFQSQEDFHNHDEFDRRRQHSDSGSSISSRSKDEEELPGPVTRAKIYPLVRF